MGTVQPERIASHRGSTGRDADGRLFERGDELLRGIAATNAADYERLLVSPAYRSLVERRLVATAERVDARLPDYELVVRHDRLARVSYPFEWAWPMLRDAGLAVLDVNLELLADGFLIKDPSPWNVLFAHTQPVYVDFTNIWKIERLGYALGAWPEWFRAFYTHPLRLVAEGKSRVVRRLARDYERGITHEEMVELGLHARERAVREGRRLARAARQRVRSRLGRTPQPTPRAPLKDGRIYHDPATWRALVQGLRDELAAVEVPVPRTKWSGYYDVSLSPNAPVDGLTEKHRNVERVLDELRPATVTDVGASTGWFSKLATEKGADVVVLESDESAVARLYSDARAGTLPILPLVMDVAEPTPAYGLGDRIEAASSRLGSDLVMALAVVHHVSLGQRLDLELVVDGLAEFTRRHLLVEWIDRADDTLLGWFGGVPEWYSEERFRSALERRFDVRDVLPSHPDTRRLYLCERR